MTERSASVPPGASPGSRSNRLFEQIAVGEAVESTRECTEYDLYLFARASHNFNPLNIPDRETKLDTDGDPATGASASALWIGALVAELIGTTLPGAGSRLRTLSLSFHGRIFAGEIVTTRIEVVEKRAPDLLLLALRTTNAQAMLVADGQCEVFTPARSLILDETPLPDVILERHPLFDRLLEACVGLAPTRIAVVCPEDEASLDGALQAWKAGLITPVLLGRADAINAAARSLGESIEALELVAADSPAAAAAMAVVMARETRVAGLMKGRIHTDELLRAVLQRDAGLRTERRMSHVFAFDVPSLAHLLFVSDAAINIAPDLAAKADIVRNAIDLAHACGLAEPRVGILCAVETVNPAMQSTIDAAVLAKMADRGQITGGLVDGPLAMDNAVDLQAARTKGIHSMVAGRAEVLIVPNLEAGNMLAKELSFVAHAEAAGIVLGAAVPVILTSRADNARSRLISCALARLLEHWRRTGTSLLDSTAR